jgi:diguanylate cyclase (GGDEF)-like protein
LPETDRDGADILASRLLESVRQPVELTSGELVPVTISIGVVSRAGAQIANAEALLQEADEALYAVKRAGRDGYSAAPDTPSRAA